MKKTVFILFLLFFWAGCASMPEKAETPGGNVFYPSLPEQPRIQFLCSISGEQDLGEKPGAFWRWLAGDVQYKVLGRPYDIAVSKGKIYILDRAYRKIVVLDLEKKEMSFLNDKGEGRLVNPSGIWVSEDGFKYVADMERKQVVVFDETDAFSRSYGDGDLFEKPVDVAEKGNRIYIVDMDKNQVFILDKASGDLVKAVGEEGDFFKPSHVTVDRAGDVFITDAFNFMIEKLAADGTSIDTIGFHGDQIGGFARPKGVAVDDQGNLYVVDAAFENVQMFNDRGELLLFFGGPGNGPGNMYLPAGVAVDDKNVGFFSQFADPNFKVDYLIYVTNTYGGQKLNVYGFGQWLDENLPDENLPESD